MAAAGGCVGSIGDRDGTEGGGASGGSDPVKPPAEAAEVGVSGLRRLTSVEYRTTVRDLTGVDVDDAELVLPTDDRTPFDNDFTKQTASQALIDGAELAAGEVATEVVADPALRAELMSCEPTGADDEPCFRTFLAEFGRRALRRPVTDAETEVFVTKFMPHAATAGDFWVAVDSALRAFLQHPAFLYRVEMGQPVDGVAGLFRLDDWEVATRLAYLIWGSAPPDWLLDDAASGAIPDGERRREAVNTLLEDPHALDRLERFHAMWMAYEALPHAPELAAAMNAETRALLEKYVLEDRRPWTDLLTADETWLTPSLAEHYGLEAPVMSEGSEAGGWVSYGDSGRRGLLSHGSFLSAVAKFEDTSPVQRGLLIRTRLFCQEIGKPPPELMVNTDEPPNLGGPDACKQDKYVMWKTDGCKTCHALLEPVGFGLESYDSAGRFRETEPDRPDCPIDGKGTLEGVGAFTGPAELGALMIEAGGVDACVATMLHRYAAGRFHLDDADKALIERLVEATKKNGGIDLVTLLGELVASESFRFRREEAVDG
ncbi:MAG: DUF1592 domain-containing protein [Polyangiaceae bacterium]